MKPTFALDLSRDIIALLHRTPKGWLSIGEVAFDAPDLDEAVDYLRKTALGLSPMGVATKIVLPNSQILYTEVEAPGPSRSDKRRQIAAALEGRTPYAVDDLVFDWSGKGSTVKVAVVARETLEEAEAFAVTHRLNPVSFVAIPEDGAFVGEPWFGPTVASETLLAPGEGVDRDREPVAIVQRDLPGAAPVELVEETAQVVPDPVPAASPAAEDDPLPGLEEALNADLPLAPVEPAPKVAAAPEPEPEPEVADIEPIETAALDTPEVPEAPPEPAVNEAPPPVAPAPAPAAPPKAEVDEAPFAHVTDSAAFPEIDDLPPMPAGLAARRDAAPAPVEDDDLPPAPPSAALVAFASRRSAAAAPAAPLGGATRSEGTTQPPTTLPPMSQSAAAARFGQPIPRPAAAKGLSGPVTAPSIPGTRTKVKGKAGGAEGVAATLAGGPTTVKSPARPGGTFGTVAPSKNRSGVVFMVLVALLLLFLAAIAAWSSFYLAGGGQEETVPAVASEDAVPAVDDEMLADLQDPAELSDSLPEADPGATAVAEGGVDVGQLATESLPVNIGGEAAPTADAVADADAVAPEPTAEPAPEAVAEAAPEPAPGTVVATDVTAAQPPVEDQDEIFLSAMDAPPPALDALALPAPMATPDAAPQPVAPPPAYGTVYQFGPDGLLKPTPEGILSPDGVMLIAGQPPLLPPSRSEVATAAAAAARTAAPPAPAETPPPEAQPTPASPADASLVAAGEAEAEPQVAPADPAMAGFRPRPRPEGLVPASDDDAALTTDRASDFAGLRPLPRPDSVLAAASASRPAAPPADLGAQGASLTAQAEAELAAAAALEASNPSIVAISKRPQGRPRDLSRAVEAAVAAAVREPEPEAEVVAAAAAAAAPEAKPEELDEANEPEVAAAAPKIPTKASVAKQATFTNAINLSKINLIGTYGTDSRRTALIRQSNGRYKKVEVGDKIDGGTIKAITESEVRYQKGGKLLTLKMPKA